MAEEPTEEKVLELATQLNLLIVFAATLVEDLPTLKKVAGQSSDISSHVMALAPVLGALGADYEEKHMEAEVRRKRANALVSFIQTLKDTEEERSKFKESQVKKREALAQLQGLGIF